MVTREVPSLEVQTLKRKLVAGIPANIFSNDTLETIHKNIDVFTDEELLNIPNIYIRGSSSTPCLVKEASEVMVVIRVATALCPKDPMLLRKLLQVFLTKHGQMCCVTNEIDLEPCAKRRKEGYFVCGTHSRTTPLSTEEYVKLVLETQAAEVACAATS